MTSMSSRQYSLASYFESLQDRVIDVDALSQINQCTIGSFVKRGWIKEDRGHRSVRWTAQGRNAFRDFAHDGGYIRKHPKMVFSKTLSLKVYDSLRGKAMAA